MAILKTGATDYHTYGIVLTVNRQIELWYPTVCPTKRGLRLFATASVIDKNGHGQGTPKAEQVRLWRSLRENYGIDGGTCRTVRLTSRISDA